jgi:exopolyphosphatase / guanosine-5'-triphosphate,3'-diphosphate pyrophosphatase
MNPEPDDSAAREEILSVMHELEKRPVHVQHVARLALQLFDALVELHGLGPRERLLLEAASLLHDIGHQSDPAPEGHHKESARMIRERGWTHFSAAEIEIVAQVARYHRRSMPESGHDEFRALSGQDRRIVQHLSALLRLADSLDRTHEQLVQRIAIELPPNRIVFRLEVAGPVLREVQAARKKGDLATAVFQRDLMFTVDGEEIIPPEPPPEQ